MVFNKSNLKFVLFGVFLVFLLALSVYFLDILTIDNIKDNKEKISAFIENHYIISVLLFFLSCTVFVNSPVPLAALLKLLGGFFFGFYLGALYNICATIIACVIGFMISRYVFKKTFEQRYYNRLQNIEKEIENNGFYYFLILRLVMVVPYFLINILAGISRMSFRMFLSSTFFGVIPASIIYANGGNKLEQINAPGDLFQMDTVLSLVLMAGVALIPLIRKKLQH